MFRTKILKRSYGESDPIFKRENASSSGKKTRPPASVRQREQQQRSQAMRAASSADEVVGKPSRRTGAVAESSASDELKEVGILDVDSSDSDEPTTPLTQPRLSARSAVGSSSAQVEKSSFDVSTQAISSAVTMLAEMIWDAIDNEHWDRLGRLVDSMYQEQFRFDAPELKQSAAAQKIIQGAPLALLEQIDGPNDPDGDNKWLLALDLVDLGCAPKVEDIQGNSVVVLLRQKADKALISTVLSDRPDLKDWLAPDTTSRSRASSDRH